MITPDRKTVALICAAVCGAMLMSWGARAEGTFFKKKRAAAAQTESAQTQAGRGPSATARVQQPQPTSLPEPERQTQPQQQPPAPPSQPAPTPTPPAPAASRNISGTVERVITSDTLLVSGQQVRLAGVSHSGGDTAGLTRWLANNGNQVTCQPLGASYQCRVQSGADVAQTVLFNGAGKAAPGASAEYRQAEAHARAAGKGVWAQR